MWANAIGVEWASFSVGTADDGSYAINGIPTGSYKVTAEQNGYVTEYYSGAYTNNDATPVEVTAPNNTLNIDFTLDIAGSISGYVYQNDGTTPISGATVGAFNLGSTFYKSATTASDGSYTMARLPEDSYHVSSSTSGYVMEYFENATIPDLSILGKRNRGGQYGEYKFDARSQRVYFRSRIPG